MTDEQIQDRSHLPRSPHGEGPLIYSSEMIFCGRKEVWIEHDENMYRLRITAAGKLYLTK
jgi:hemin uptake protein HemP